MARINKPETDDNHHKQLEKLDLIAEYLLESCDPDTTVYQEAKFIRAKLEELRPHFEGRKSINVSPHGLVNRLRAKKQGLLNLPSTGEETPKEKDPVFIGRPFAEVVEKDKAIYRDLAELNAALANLDEADKVAEVSCDTDLIADGLHKPEVFNSPEFQEILIKYLKKTRGKLEALGMTAFMKDSAVSHSEISGLLERNA
jgi:hypothetical protein